MEETVLIYIENNNKYLMMLRNKKHHDMNKGKYIGIGGHIEPGESKEDAVKRETYEETGLILNSFLYRAKILFVNDDYSEIMYLYTSSDFSGNLNYVCNEGELYWVPRKDIFSVPLWEGDKAFLDIMLNSDEYFEMELVYKNDSLISSRRTK